MTSFFGAVGKKLEGIPFSSPVVQLIDQATDASLASENWALNMEICDLVNESEDNAKDAFKAIRKKLHQSAAKNHQVVMYTLVVLETCIKNCGRKFQVLVCTHDFIMELVKLIVSNGCAGPKNEPPTVVQEKVLGLIQSWSDAFRNQPDCQGVIQVYNELRTKGIEFPMTDLDCMAPIHTPIKTIRETTRIAGTGEVSTALGPDQLAKLKKELDVVETNMFVFGEMLTEMNPRSEHPADWQFLQDLNSTCKEMQERLVELIPRLSNDELTADLLRINDFLNILFLRFSRYEKKREAVKEGRVAGDGDEEASLIDLNDGPTPDRLAEAVSNMGIGSQLANLTSVPAQSGRKPDKDDKEFDVLAQSRNVAEQVKNSGSTYESNRKPDQVSGSLGALTEAKALGTQMHKESDFDEMAAWLGDAGARGGGEETSMTSSEFDRFLAERAAAAEALPTQPPARPS